MGRVMWGSTGLLGLLWTAAVLGQVPAPSGVAPGAGRFSVANRPNPASAVSNALPPPVFTRLASFTIPYTVSQLDGRAFEVWLFVSIDKGAHWNLQAKQSSAAGKFLIQPGRDGEYWFASRTVIAGTPPPAADKLDPQLRMIVDTVEPKLDAKVALTPAGEISVTWDIFDEYLAPQTLKIEYQAASDKPWQAARIDGPAPNGSPTPFRGRTAWRPGPGPQVVNVRIEVADQAQNVARVTRRVTVPANLPGPPVPPKPDDPAGAPPDPFAAHGLPADSSGRPLPQDAVSGEKPAAQAAPTRPSNPGESWPSDKTRAASPGTAQASQPTASRSWSAVKSAEAGSAAARNASTSVPGSGAETVARPQESGSANPERPSPGAPENAGAEASDTAQPNGSGLPPGERPRMTRSKQLRLDYSVDAVGPGGLEKVELWVTRNGGRNWQLWGPDEDRQSPIHLTVENEGLYGFRIVLVGKNGLASPTPRAGDLADLWVCVDTTLPTVEITSAAYGEAEHAGQLDIRWKAQDANLTARPITLQFSDSLNGKWSTIASGLPNTGQYYWRVDSRIPDKFYLRVEARDEAGNVGAFQLNEPILSAGLVPRGRIQAIEPIDN